jgi:MFS family permease
MIAVLSDAVFLFGGFADRSVLIGLAAIFGGTFYSVYPVILAHANDHAAPGASIQVSGGLLLVHGVGSMAGPTIAGFAMSTYGTPSLFAVTGVPTLCSSSSHLHVLDHAPQSLLKTGVSFKPYQAHARLHRKPPRLQQMKRKCLWIARRTARPNKRCRQKPIFNERSAKLCDFKSPAGTAAGLNSFDEIT